MPQGVLPFQYVEDRSLAGMTALAGLPLYLELAEVAGLPAAIDGHVGVRKGSQGWTDRQMVMSLILLNLAGGDGVEDLRILEGDRGFSGLLGKVENHSLSRKERRELGRRWRNGRRRSVPSPSAVFRYLARFHDAGEEKKREAHRAFIPAPKEGLRGLGEVNGEVLAFVQKRAPVATATLDMDATLIETHKEQALVGYQGYKAYQPLTTYWAEQGLVVHSEFRDGNVPAGYEQLRVLQEALALVPAGVKQVRLRSDTAGYQQDLLRYCAEGENQRFGVMEFAVGVDVTPEFRQAVAQTVEEEWHPLEREVEGGGRRATGQEWAEVCFVPNWVGHRKGSAEYRYLAIREPLRQMVLPGMEVQLPFPTVECSGTGYKLTGVITNRTLPGDEVIWWYRERCGKSEEAHGIMKEDLAGGKMPSADFGENAAWWAIILLAFNLHRAMQRLVLGASWVGKRLKAVRFGLISLPGRVVEHARRLLLKVSAPHPTTGLLLESRRRILALAQGPPS